MENERKESGARGLDDVHARASTRAPCFSSSPHAGSMLFLNNEDVRFLQKLKKQHRDGFRSEGAS